MAEKEFNLLDEPWIRVMLPDCAVREVSLLEALTQAHAFSALAGELPHDPALYYALSAATTVKLCVSDAAQPPLFDWTLAGTDKLRGRVAAALEVLASKRDVLLPRKHGNMPL